MLRTSALLQLIQMHVAADMSVVCIFPLRIFTDLMCPAAGSPFCLLDTSSALSSPKAICTAGRKKANWSPSLTEPLPRSAWGPRKLFIIFAMMPICESRIPVPRWKSAEGSVSPSHRQQRCAGWQGWIQPGHPSFSLSAKSPDKWHVAYVISYFKLLGANSWFELFSPHLKITCFLYNNQGKLYFLFLKFRFGNLGFVSKSGFCWLTSIFSLCSYFMGHHACLKYICVERLCMLSPQETWNINF